MRGSEGVWVGVSEESGLFSEDVRSEAVVCEGGKGAEEGGGVGRPEERGGRRGEEEREERREREAEAREEEETKDSCRK